MAVRQALGGAPSRLMRQLLTEGVVLAVLGGILGVAVVFASKSFLVRLVPDGVPMFNEVSINWGVLLFALGASLVAGAVFGLAPALHLRDLDVTGVLKLEGRGATATRRQKRTRRMLVVAEFALSLVLLSTAGLLARSFWRLLDVPLGFDPRNVTVLRTRLPYPNDRREDLYPTVAAETPFVREVIRRCSALPGVDEVALGSGAAVPLDHPYQDQAVLRVRFEGDASHGEQPLFVTGSEVTPEYFHLLGPETRAGPTPRRVRCGQRPAGRRDQREHGPDVLAGRGRVGQADEAVSPCNDMDYCRRHRCRRANRVAREGGGAASVREPISAAGKTSRHFPARSCRDRLDRSRRAR